MRGHTHRCSQCGAEIRCAGYRVDNYDGFPPVLCSVEAEMQPGDQFLCEDCAESGDAEARDARRGAA